ncbi:hypothetical protein MPL1032_30117 [Mesorhizobium plurifarium]|uniref:Uncharacterized protein n=1 Tax=Mesorhizobium plurifarium TaxID=69974 RepID=A0A0K2W2R6_MESPL|nr:hypothetical protein MPL1032_30117 [Mesorhizobium plurifarium]
MSTTPALIELLQRQIGRLEHQKACFEADGLSDAASYIGLQAAIEKSTRDLAALQALVYAAASLE